MSKKKPSKPKKRSKHAVGLQRQTRKKTRRDEPAKKLLVDPEDLREMIDDADDLKPGLLENQMDYLKSL